MAVAVAPWTGIHPLVDNARPAIGSARPAIGNVRLAIGNVRLAIGNVRLALVEARPVVQLIFAMRFVAAFALVYGSGPGQVPFWWLPVALVTWECASISAYLFDGVMDIVEDRLNGSPRPIASGRLPRGTALAISLIFAAFALVGSWVLGGPFVYLVPAALALGWAYAAPPLRLKRWSTTSGLAVLAGGLLTFAAGGSARGGLPHSTELAVFALAMSLWMGLVGAVAKDFADVRGDEAAGRRTLAVVGGVQRAARRLTGNALALAVAFLAVAIAVAPALLPPAVIVLIGAVVIALACARLTVGTKRRPYRTFMVTQYAAHLSILAAALVA